MKSDRLRKILETCPGDYEVSIASATSGGPVESVCADFALVDGEVKQVGITLCEDPQPL